MPANVQKSGHEQTVVSSAGPRPPTLGHLVLPLLRALRQVRQLRDPGLRNGPRYVEGSDAAAAHARSVLTAVGNLDQFRAASYAINDALIHDHASRRDIAYVAAALADGWPTFKPGERRGVVANWLDFLCAEAELQDWPPAIVAAGAYALLRDSTFAPTCAELASRIADAMRAAEEAFHLIGQLELAVIDAEVFLAPPADRPVDDDEIPF
jgi:hypothetical protein